MKEMVFAENTGNLQDAYDNFVASKIVSTIKKYQLHARNMVPLTTGNPGSVIVPQYGSSKITVFVWGKNTILKFLGNTK